VRTFLLFILIAVLTHQGFCDTNMIPTTGEDSARAFALSNLVGRSEGDVQSALGEPLTKVSVPSMGVLWYYSNSVVTIKDGKVSTARISRAGFTPSQVAYFQRYTNTASARFIGKVPLVFDNIPIPADWKTNRNMQVSLLYPSAQWDSITTRFGNEFAKYPQALLDRTIRAIMVPAKMATGGDSIGGLCVSADWFIYVARAPDFHHEYAHLLHGRFHGFFPSDAWKAQNGEPYTEDGRLVRLNWSQNESLGGPWYHERGFINRYAMVSEEEDFAELMRVTMNEPAVVARAAREFPRLNAKLDILLKYLEDLSVRLANDHEPLPIRAALQEKP
jgi:hypothetical protein